MKLSLVRTLKLFLGVFIVSSPLLVFAQTTDLPSLFDALLEILNDYVVPVIFALAFIMFLWGVYRYFIAGGANEEKVKEGQKFVLWSVIGFVLMFSIWGIINLFINTLGFDTTDRPAFPTFGTSGQGAQGSYFGGLGSGIPGTGSPGTGFLGAGTPSGFLGTGLGASLPSGSLQAGQVFQDSTGQQFTATGPNSYMPNSSGSCGAAGTLIGSQCITNNNPYGTGPSCTNNTQCSGKLVCNDTTQTCTPDGPNVYSCDDDTTPNAQGKCGDGSYPMNQDGQDAPTNGEVGYGGSCAGNEDACSGNLTCDDSVGGICDNSNSTGSGVPADGSVPQGGSCAGNENACAIGTCDSDNTCADDNSQNSVNSDGTISCDYGPAMSAQYSCVLCSDGQTTADSVSYCPADASGGYTGGSENGCQDGQNYGQDCSGGSASSGGGGGGD